MKTSEDVLSLGIDANEDIRYGDVDTLIESLSMTEAIRNQHSARSPPATYNRNYQRQPIDGLWVSDELEILRSGYTEFGGSVPSDHRSLWIDFHYTEIFGHSISPTVRPTARRLKSSDPRLVSRYIALTKRAFKEHGLFKRLFSLSVAMQREGLNPSLEEEFNSIQSLHASIRSTIEQGLRRLRMGGIPWSPKLQRYRDTIEIWWMVVRKRRNVHVSTKRIRRFIRRLGLTNALRVPLPFAERELKMARIAYKAAKKNADVWRDDHIISLAQSRATKNLPLIPI